MYFFLLVFQYILKSLQLYQALYIPCETNIIRMKMKNFLIYTVFFFILSPLLSNAQKSRAQKIDSLEKVLKTIDSDSLRIDIKGKLCKFYVGVDSLRSFKLGYEALRLSKKNNNKKGLASAYFSLGYAFISYDDIKNAKKHYTLSKDIYVKLMAVDSTEQNIINWVKVTYNLGTIFGREGYVNKELKTMIEVVPILEKTKDIGLMAIVNSNIGVRFVNIKDYGKAYHYFIKSDEMFKKTNRVNAHIYSNLVFSDCLLEMDSIVAMKTILDDVKIRLDQMPKAWEWNVYYTQIGRYHSSISEYDKALDYYDNAKKSIGRNKIAQHLEVLYSAYMTTYEATNNYKKAKEYALKHLTLLENNKFGEKRVDTYKKLAKYEEKDKNFTRAYGYLSKYRQLRDSITVDSMNLEVRQLELLFQTEKKEKKILDLKNKNSETALEIEKRLSLSYLMVMIIGVLAIVLTAGYIIYKNKFRKAKIKERKRETEVKELRQEQENKVFSAMIESQEKERKRLAIDLHDGLGEKLSGISLNLSKLNKDEPKQYPKKQLRKVMKDLSDSLTELRGIARNMMPETLLKFGLHAALKDYCSSMNNTSSKVTLQFYGSDKGISTTQQVTMFRVIQELINNAIKHAKASEVLVQYMREENIIDITVEDNGIGIDKKTLENEASGMGLANLRTRVAYLNGNLDFQAVKEEGTTVNVHINIDVA